MTSIPRITTRRINAIFMLVNLKHFTKATTVQIPMMSELIQFISVSHQDSMMPTDITTEMQSIGLNTHTKGLFKASHLKSHKISLEQIAIASSPMIQLRTITII